MICETCGKHHNGDYGSGRFCSAICARRFSSKHVTEDGRRRQKEVLTNKDIRDKALNSFKQNSENYEMDENGTWKKIPKQKKKKDDKTELQLGSKSNMRTMIKGKVGELETAIKFINHGYNVFVPLVDISGADMIVEKDDGLKKVQVKSSAATDDDNRITKFHLCSNVYEKGNGARKKKYNKKEVDYFALYSEVNNDVYLMENNGDQSSVIIRNSISPTSLTSKGKNLEKMHMAADYQIDKVLDDIDNGITQSNTIVVDDYIEKDDN